MSQFHFSLQTSDHSTSPDRDTIRHKIQLESSVHTHFGQRSPLVIYHLTIFNLISLLTHCKASCKPFGKVTRCSCLRKPRRVAKTCKCVALFRWLLQWVAWRRSDLSVAALNWKLNHIFGDVRHIIHANHSHLSAAFICGWVLLAYFLRSFSLFIGDVYCCVNNNHIKFIARFLHIALVPLMLPAAQFNSNQWNYSEIERNRHSWFGQLIANSTVSFR